MATKRAQTVAQIKASEIRVGDTIIEWVKASFHDLTVRLPRCLAKVETVIRGGDSIFINATQAQVDSEDAELDLIEFDADELVEVRR